MQCQRPQRTSSPISSPRETRTQNQKTPEIKPFHTQIDQKPQTEKSTHFDFWGWFFEAPKIEQTKTIEEKQKKVLKEVTSFSLENFAPLLKLEMDAIQRDELKKLGRSLMALHDKLKDHKSSDESTLRKDEIEFEVLKSEIRQKESEILKKQEEKKQFLANKVPKMEAAVQGIETRFHAINTKIQSALLEKENTTAIKAIIDAKQKNVHGIIDDVKKKISKLKSTSEIADDVEKYAQELERSIQTLDSFYLNDLESELQDINNRSTNKANLYPEVTDVKSQHTEIKAIPLSISSSEQKAKEIATNHAPKEKPKTSNTQGFKANMKSHLINCGSILGTLTELDPFYGTTTILIGIPCSLLYLSGALIYEGISYYRRRKNS